MTTTLKMAQLIDDIRTEAQGWRNEKMHEAADMMDNWANCIEALTAHRAAADTEREAFEAAQTQQVQAYSNERHMPHLERTGDGYQNPLVHAAWQGWLARAALSQEPAYCPNCRGTGETTVMSDNSPYAYEMPVVCPHCEGHQTLEAAYAGVCKLLDAEQKKYLKACGEVWRMSNGAETDWKDMFEKRTRERDALRARLDKYEKDDVVYPVAAPVQQEAKPVAWHVGNADGTISRLGAIYLSRKSAKDHIASYNGELQASIVPLYAAPPQAEAQSKSDKQEDGGRGQ